MGSLAGLRGGGFPPNAVASASLLGPASVANASTMNVTTIGRSQFRFNASVGRFGGQNRSPTLVDKLASKHNLTEAQVEQKVKQHRNAHAITLVCLVLKLIDEFPLNIVADVDHADKKPRNGENAADPRGPVVAKQIMGIERALQAELERVCCAEKCLIL